MSEPRPDRTLGPRHDMFWQYCGQGELRVPKCTACGKLVWPVLKACDRCGDENFEWARMSGRGKLVSWCSFVQDYYKATLPVPYDTILVELEEGLLFISIPDGFTEADMSPGMQLELRLRDCHDSAGAFRLPVFVRA